METARVSLTQSAIDEIKGMIVRGELGPGDRLPKESELAARLGLSRGSLREAVRGLTLIRVLEVRQGDGTYVTSLRPELLLESLRFFADLNQETTVPHVLDARRMLEAGAAAQAAHRATDVQLAGLARLVEAMGDCETIEAFVDNDLAFHRLIAVAAGNPVVVALLTNLSSRATHTRVWRGIAHAGAHGRTQEEHRAIHAALAQRRADVASALVTAHVAGVEAWLGHAGPDQSYSAQTAPPGNAWRSSEA